ncbi:MAG: 2-oxo acid dehydrogenase subunit E2 [Acidobacteriota bacterium]
MATEFKLPELGEQIESGDVLRVMVKPGDTLAKEQPVLELETDKATIEVPSSVAGKVKEIKVSAGDKVKVGQTILTLEDADESAGSKDADEPDQDQPERSESAPAPRSAPTAKADRAAAKSDRKPAKKTETIAPPGTDDPAGGAESASESGRSDPDDEEAPEDEASQPPVDAKRASASAGAGARRKSDSAKKATPQEPDDADDAPAASPRARSGATGADKVVDISRGSRPAADAPAGPEVPPAPAAPSVRRMARELGIDIHDVPGTGGGGRISEEDVKTHVNRLVGAAATGVSGAAPLPDFSRWGGVERVPMRGVRRKTAQHLTAAWTTIPHVTQHDLADVTAIEELRKHYAKQVEAAGGNLTFTAIAVKVVAAALRAFPQFNVSIDMAAEEIIQKQYVHIGVAVDTDRGLLVPVIRDADTKSIIQLAVELSQLSEKARNRKLGLDEMQGGCFSISNLGGIGGTAFTPIVNTPEVGVLGISRARMEPVYQGTQFVPRLMLPLSLSYDHRVVDGADGIRFLRWIIEALEQPFLLLLHG